MRLKIAASLIVCLLLAGMFSAVATTPLREKIDADPLSGEWDVSFYVQDKTYPATFTLELDGNKVTGTAYSEHTGAGTLRDGSWAENKLTFTLDFAKHESIAITGHLEGDKLVGEFTTEGFTAKWDAKKKANAKPAGATVAPNALG
ncbi:MAG TPA: hypothetical protein DC047_03635 [Blastocatellia bacterium]|nr:hypothetical protein [Blastocatellia bacterium]